MFLHSQLKPNKHELCDILIGLVKKIKSKKTLRSFKSQLSALSSKFEIGTSNFKKKCGKQLLFLFDRFTGLPPPYPNETKPSLISIDFKKRGECGCSTGEQRKDANQLVIFAQCTTFVARQLMITRA